jgi:cysteate synthase
MVSQNDPFIPLAEAWKAGSRHLFPLDENHARKQVEEIDAKVLSNRKPPYPIVGGLFDALTDSGGDVLVATNEQARAAAKLFEESEGIDIHPAAAVATATLIDAVKNHRISHEAVVMLNITGGGEKRFKEGNELYFMKPDLVFDIDPDPQDVVEKVSRLF